MTDIEHFIVLMLENRSFDHIFGFFPGLTGSQGLSGNEFNVLNPSKPASSTNPKFFVTKNAPWRTSGEGPSHSLNGTNLQLAATKNGPTSFQQQVMTGFVEDYKSALSHSRTNRVTEPTAEQLGEVMASFAPDALPSINALAKNYCLCTRWHSEVPGPTQPNRLFMHAGSSMGLVHNAWGKKFDCKTIYENLDQKGKTWATYQVGTNSKFNEVREFNNINQQLNSFRIFDEHFEADMHAGQFPNYSFIVPRYVSDNQGAANSQHAPDDVRYGDNLIADVYEALRKNEDVWAKSVLIVTYDEHGGFYDHVPPPFGVPNPDGINAPLPEDPDFVPSFDFTRLGLRVPAIIASPWIEGESTCDIQLQHTSILATVKKWFSLPDFLTKRDANAKTFDGLFRDQPRTNTPLTLPRAPIDKFKSSDARHHTKQPLDESRLEMIQGVARRMDPDATWRTNTPPTHGDAAMLAGSCIEQHFPTTYKTLMAPPKPVKKTTKKTAAGKAKTASKNVSKKAPKKHS